MGIQAPPGSCREPIAGFEAPPVGHGASRWPRRFPWAAAPPFGWGAFRRLRSFSIVPLDGFRAFSDLKTGKRRLSEVKYEPDFRPSKGVFCDLRLCGADFPSFPVSADSERLICDSIVLYFVHLAFFCFEIPKRP